MAKERKSTERLLVFDLDNTLINRDRAMRAFTVNFLEKHRTALMASVKRDLVQDLIALDIQGLCPRKRFMEKALALMPGLAMTPGAFWSECRKIPDYVEKDPLVADMLERLSTRYDMTVVSNGSGKLQRKKMARAGIDRFFQTCFISGEEGCAKPRVKLFRKALDTLGYEPSDAVMIGDDPLKDIRPAKVLGMKTVFVSMDNTMKNPYADIIISHILELYEVLTCLT